MENFLLAVLDSMRTKNWYAALGMALILPDICGRLENPNSTSKERYVAWYDKWMRSKYTRGVGPNRKEKVFLSGSDCYALRCAILHEGRDDIAEQRAREAISSFRFNTPHPFIHMHCNLVNSILQLQVDEFCQDICDATCAWIANNDKNKDVSERSKSLLAIYDTSKGIPGILSIG